MNEKKIAFSSFSNVVTLLPGSLSLLCQKILGKHLKGIFSHVLWINSTEIFAKEFSTSGQVTFQSSFCLLPKQIVKNGKGFFLKEFGKAIDGIVTQLDDLCIEI